ncbi:retrovirus-related pol polyprotein from transposon TNT 1-94 [Tanacetum coccineum]
MDSVKPRVLAPSKYVIDVEPIPPRNRNNREVHLDYLKHLKESVETLREIVKEAKVERTLDKSIASSCLYTKHSQELLEYVIGTCPKDFNKRDKKHASTPLTRKKQFTFEDQCETSDNNIYKHVEQLKIQKTNVPVIPSIGVNSCTDASGSKPRSNTKKNRISSAKGVNKKKVEHLKTNKSSLKNVNRVDSSISSKCTVVQIVLWYLDSGCSKHMTGDRSRLRNFVKKFIGIIRFGNDHFGAIMGYEDYVIGDSVISKHSCYVRDTDGVDLIKGSRGFNLHTISVEDIMKSSPICLLSKASKNKSWLWHRCLNHLNFGTINDLPRKDLERAKKHTHTPKTENTNLEVLNTLHMDLCGPMHVQTNNGKKYILVIIDGNSKFTWVKFLRSKDQTPEFVIKFLKQIQVGLNKTVRYIRTDNGTELVNQVLTEYYESVDIFHQKSVLRTLQQNGFVERRNRTLMEAARTILISSKALMFLWAEVFNSAGTPSSTTIDQDAPSPSHLPSSSALQSPSSHLGVAAGSTIIIDNPFAHVDNDPFVNVFASEPSSEASSSRDVSSTESTHVTQPHHHLEKWSKDHPLDNVIGNPSRPVSTRKQLTTDTLWCLYNSVLSKVEPKNFKYAVTKDCWFQAMQDEIHEFDRL